jgi:hypothetical protein
MEENATEINRRRDKSYYYVVSRNSITSTIGKYEKL